MRGRKNNHFEYGLEWTDQLSELPQVPQHQMPEPINDLSKLILKSAFKIILNFTIFFLFHSKIKVFHYQTENRQQNSNFKKFIQDWLNMKIQ